MARGDLAFWFFVVKQFIGTDIGGHFSKKSIARHDQFHQYAQNQLQTQRISDKNNMGFIWLEQYVDFEVQITIRKYLYINISYAIKLGKY